MRPRFMAKRTRKEMERHRLSASRDLQRGRGKRGTPAAVARRHGVNPVTAMRWARIVETKGIDGVRSTKAKGAPPRLTKSQRERLRTTLLEGAIAHGYATDVWTGRRGADLLHRRFGHLGDRRIKATQALAGGEVPGHPATCRCRECVEWVMVLASDDDDQSSLGRRLPAAEQFGKGYGERV